MGLGSLKILLPQEISHDKILDFFSFIGNSPQPGISQLLGGLCHVSGTDDLFFFNYALVVHYCFSPPASVFVPSMLQAIATEVSLLMAGIALNFV